MNILRKEDFNMCEKVNFNVIEKTKTENIADISKYITALINKLIVNEFAGKSWILLLIFV